MLGGRRETKIWELIFFHVNNNRNIWSSVYRKNICDILSYSHTRCEHTLHDAFNFKAYAALASSVALCQVHCVFLSLLLEILFFKKDGGHHFLGASGHGGPWYNIPYRLPRPFDSYHATCSLTSHFNAVQLNSQQRLCQPLANTAKSKDNSIVTSSGHACCICQLQDKAQLFDRCVRPHWLGVQIVWALRLTLRNPALTYLCSRRCLLAMIEHMEEAGWHVNSWKLTCFLSTVLFSLPFSIGALNSMFSSF